MANGRCRLHGGRTPKGSQWHVRQKPATGAPDALEQKIRRQAKKQKRRAALVAQATPEQREAHEAWHKSHQPGDPKKRTAERVRRKQNREAAAILRQERPTSSRSAERAALVAQLEALQRQPVEAATAEAEYQGVFS